MLHVGLGNDIRPGRDTAASEHLEYEGISPHCEHAEAQRQGVPREFRARRGCAIGQPNELAANEGEGAMAVLCPKGCCIAGTEGQPARKAPASAGPRLRRECREQRAQPADGGRGRHEPALRFVGDALASSS